MNNIILRFFSLQKIFILNLIFFVLVPYFLVLKFLPEIPYIQYFFIVIVFCLKVLVFNEGSLKNKIKPKVYQQLYKEIGKPPSNKQIFQRVQFHISSRDISLGIVGFIIVVVAILFNRF